jgi:CubicO group peptidase (beta-lactamase class C family)
MMLVPLWLYAARLGSAAAAHDPGGLGPGAGPWAVATPESVGLSTERLAQAAERHGLVRERYCLLVVKGGKLVHETYHVNSSDTKYETDSLGKTMISELVGAVHTKFPFDLDQPIAELGVDTSDFNQWSPNITMRHLLSQTTGVGRAPPGQFLTYDSDDYIQHIAPALGKIIDPTGNVTLFDWATEHFAKPMGFPDVFRDNDMYVYPNVSIGGGQHMTCRQIARIGQLLLNKGQWPAAADPEGDGGSGPGATQQLVSPSYMRDLARQNFPEWGSSYGFLTWLNRPGQSPTYCCAPRWCRGPAIGQPPKMLMSGIIGDDISHGEEVPGHHSYGGGPLQKGPVVTAPPDALIAYGWLARSLIVLPSLDTVVVSMGQTVGQSQTLGQCDYDEGYSITLIWNAIADALLHRPPSAAGSPPAAATAAPPPSPPSPPPPPPPPPPVSSPASVVHGSCFLYCPPNEGYGVCFDVNVTEPPAPGGPPGQLCPVTAIAQSGAGPAKVGSGGGNYTQAWDGFVQTFFDLPYPDGGWTQASLPEAQSIARIDWWPRAGFLERSVGGQFVGLTVGTPQRVVHLGTVGHVPELAWNVLTVTELVPLQSVRYVGANGSYGNIAEIKLFTANCTTPSTAVAASQPDDSSTAVPNACQAFAGRAGEFCPSVGIARQCGPQGADCADQSRGGLTRGLSCVESPGQRKTVLSPPRYCESGQLCPGGLPCPPCSEGRCACPRHNQTSRPCDGHSSQPLLETLFCTCSSTSWNGGDFKVGTTCAAHATGDGTIRRRTRGGGWRLPGTPAY